MQFAEEGLFRTKFFVEVHLVSLSHNLQKQKKKEMGKRFSENHHDYFFSFPNNIIHCSLVNINNDHTK